MMRTWILGIIAVLLGVGIGTGLTYYEMAAAGDHFDDRSGNASEVAAKPRVAVVGEGTFDFGTLERNRSGDHVFRIRNDGSAPLVLGLDGYSCGKCVQTDLERVTVQPNQTTEVKVTYKTQKPGPKFTEYVDLRTSDPTQPVIRLNIFGYVVQPLRLSVDDTLALGSLPSSEPSEAEFSVFAYQGDQIEILEHEFTDPATADFFEVDVEPLAANDIAAEPHATVGARIRLRIKAGLPLGPISQTLRFKTRLADQDVESEMAVRGNVVGDIMILGGSNFVRDQNLLRLRVVPHEEGASATLRLRVKGPYRDDVKFEVAEVDPAEALQVEVGDPNVLADGTMYLYPLTISVRKDAPRINRLGTSQGKVGVVRLATNHPDAGELPIYVSFAIE